MLSSMAPNFSTRLRCIHGKRLVKLCPVENKARCPFPEDFTIGHIGKEITRYENCLDAFMHIIEQEPNSCSASNRVPCAGRSI